MSDKHVEIEVEVKEEKLRKADMKYSLEDTPSLPICILLGFQVNDLNTYSVLTSEAYKFIIKAGSII